MISLILQAGLKAMNRWRELLRNKQFTPAIPAQTDVANQAIQLSIHSVHITFLHHSLLSDETTFFFIKHIEGERSLLPFDSFLNLNTGLELRISVRVTPLQSS